MLPTLRSGDWLVAERLSYRHRLPRPGELVLARDPRDPRRELVKRVAALTDAGQLELRGDAPAGSTDSRTFGSVAVDAVRWRVAARYRPLRRARLF